MIDWSRTDAIVFDMDGTLWDAVDSYCEIWNRCFAMFDTDLRIHRPELLACMGMPLDEIYRSLTAGRIVPDASAFLPAVEREEAQMMSKLGGRPYPGMQEGIRRLSESYPVFLLSNCGVSGLADMMRFTGITPYVREAITFGATQRRKSENLRWLKKKYGFMQPVYVGDTEGDCQETHLAGLPFVYASYGFGTCSDADLAVDTFQEIVDYFLNLKR